MGQPQTRVSTNRNPTTLTNARPRQQSSSVPTGTKGRSTAGSISKFTIARHRHWAVRNGRIHVNLNAPQLLRGRRTKIRFMSSLRGLPSVDRLLRDPRLETILHQYGRSMVTDVIRRVIAEAREDIAGHGDAIDEASLVDRVTRTAAAQ